MNFRAIPSRSAVGMVLAAACGMAAVAPASSDAPRIAAGAVDAIEAAAGAATALVFADLAADDALLGTGGAAPETVVLPVALGGIVDAARSAMMPAPISRVPEPGIFALVFAGLAVVIWRVRRQRGR